MYKYIIFDLFRVIIIFFSINLINNGLYGCKFFYVRHICDFLAHCNHNFKSIMWFIVY